MTIRRRSALPCLLRLRSHVVERVGRRRFCCSLCGRSAASASELLDQFGEDCR